MPTSSPDYFQLSYEVTRRLSEGLTTGVALRRVLELLAKGMGFDFASFWIVDDRRLLLTCSVVWRGADFPAGTDFERVTEVRDYHMNEGSLGVAWVKNELKWIPDVMAEPTYARASVATPAGVKSSVIFPVYADKSVLGVVELVCLKPRAEDETAQRFLRALGGQIGVFLERARIRAELQELDSQFLLVAGASSEAIVTIDDKSTMLFVNPALERMFGYSAKELLGKSLSELMPERMREAHRLGLARYIATGKKNIPWRDVRLPGLHKDGRELELEIAFAEFTRQGKRVFTGFIRHVQKPAETE